MLGAGSTWHVADSDLKKLKTHQPSTTISVHCATDPHPKLTASDSAEQFREGGGCTNEKTSARVTRAASTKRGDFVFHCPGRFTVLDGSLSSNLRRAMSSRIVAGQSKTLLERFCYLSDESRMKAKAEHLFSI